MKYVLRFVLLLAMGTGTAFAQSATQRLEKVNNQNAYVWYPQGYDTAKVKRWPLIVFFPGAGETGTDAKKLLTYGPSKFIAEGKLKPDAVVISVQPTTQWPNQNTVKSSLDAIKKAYKVDPDNVHLTGISSGGNAVESFGLTPDMAKTVKSIFPYAATEASALYGNVPAVIKLPLRWYFFVGFNDSQFGRQYQLYNKMALLDPYKVEFESDESGHSGFNKVYDPSFKLRKTDVNIYDWMLQGDSGPIPPIDTADLQYCVGPADKIRKVIVLLKNGQYQEFDSGHVYIPTIKFP